MYTLSTFGYCGWNTMPLSHKQSCVEDFLFAHLQIEFINAGEICFMKN